MSDESSGSSIQKLEARTHSQHKRAAIDRIASPVGSGRSRGTDYLEVSDDVEQQVLRLQVSVHDVEMVEVLENENDL